MKKQNHTNFYALILVGSVATRLPIFAWGEFIGDCIGDPSGDPRPLLSENPNEEPNWFLKGEPNPFI